MESAANWQRVRALFHDALDRPLEERTKFLEVACADDENLRREVESLLAAEAGAAGFMESPAHRLAAAGELLPVPAMAPGDRVGDLEVIGPLGSGGMGEVYRARDVKLRREVALKLLPPGVGADPQRLARFTRESRILAALSHPNIAAIYSVEHVDGLHVLVLELVEGPTLADRLGAGALLPREALAIARELALALEAAHERGIVHRDLKPANIKLPLAASVKLLDFGIAKEHVPASAGQPHQPETVLERTTDGLILGTCAYMSPEQARGKPVDKRTDIWAFGCVLFEMLTGTRAFDGETRSDTIAAVLLDDARSAMASSI